jgi:hypothetical protein
MGFDYFKELRSLFAVRCERRMRRSDPMKLQEGASEWAGPRKKSGKSQRFSVRFSPLEGLLVYRGKFTLISPAGQVKPFLMLIRGTVWKCRRIQEWSTKEDQERWNLGALRCRSRFVSYIFCF